MSKPETQFLDFFDRHVTMKIVEKYGIDERTALRDFLLSETYQMLLDKETDIYMMSPEIVFELWETEKITGDPRNSRYVRA